MKTVQIFFLTWIFMIQLNGQVTFSLLIKTEKNELPTSIIEDLNHDYILSTGQSDSMQGDFKQVFYKISRRGNILSSLTIGDSAKSFGVGDMIRIQYSNIFCLGSISHRGTFSENWIICVDTNLEIQWQKSHESGFFYNTPAYACMNSKGNIVTVNCLYNVPDSRNLSFGEYNSFGDTISSGIVQQYHPMPFDIEEINFRQYKIPVMGMDQMINSRAQIITLDSTLNMIKVDSIPNFVGNCSTVRKKCDSTFYLTGNYYKPFSYKGYDISCLELNNVDRLKNFITLGKANDTNDFGGYLQSMDFINQSNIFIAGTSNFNVSPLGYFVPVPSWFILCSLDSNLHLNWTRFYGGDAYYVLSSVVSTSDGGAMMIGTRYDYLAGATDLDTYVLKVDSMGLLTGVPNIEKVSHDVILYPNPGNDFINIQAGPQIFGADLSFYDLKGKKIFEKKINETSLRISSAFLTSGIYPWHVRYNGKIIESGKWIKR